MPIFQRNPFLPQDLPSVEAGTGPRHTPGPVAVDTGLVWVSEQIGRPIIKAFNNILAHSLAELSRPAGSPDCIAVAVAGDDAEAKRMVMDIVSEVGFDPVETGSLAESWRQQPGTPGYCCDYDAETMRNALAEAVPGKAPAIRNQLHDRIGQLSPNPSHADIIDMNRSVHIGNREQKHSNLRNLS